VILSARSIERSTGDPILNELEIHTVKSRLKEATIFTSITDYWFYLSFPICSSARPPHRVIRIQPNGAAKQCLLSENFGLGRTDGRTDGQKLSKLDSKVATKEKKNSLETVATFSSPILNYFGGKLKIHVHCTRNMTKWV
jgi:hypothetical protein